MSTKLKAGTATSGAVIDADTSGILELQSGSTPTTAITVDASQNVGIGTASPTGKTTINYNANSAYNTGLSVYNANSGSSAVTAFQLTNDAGNRAGAYLTSSTCAFYGGANTFNLGTVESIPFTFLTGNSERMRVDTSGNLLVGTTSTPNYGAGTSRMYMQASGTNWGVGPTASFGNFYVKANNSLGVVLTPTATAWASDSDERLKTELTPFENPVEKVCSLRAGTGKYLSDELNISRSFLIAQDVQKVLPEAVDEGEDENKTLQLRYTDVIPLLVASIKELNAKVTALEAQLGVK